MQFVDTNIFLRHLTGDDLSKAQACLTLFKQAQQNQIQLTTSETVIAEIVYILSSKTLYNLSREQIRVRLDPLLSLPGLKLPYRQTYQRALELYVSHSIDFEDALAIAHMERDGISEIYSYDRDFDKTSSVKRLEP
ncbi:MAG: PIN domain-containing protein [Caldilineaceae bacterium]